MLRPEQTLAMSSDKRKLKYVRHVPNPVMHSPPDHANSDGYVGRRAKVFSSLRIDPREIVPIRNEINSLTRVEKCAGCYGGGGAIGPYQFELWRRDRGRCRADRSVKRAIGLI